MPPASDQGSSVRKWLRWAKVTHNTFVPVQRRRKLSRESHPQSNGWKRVCGYIILYFIDTFTDSKPSPFKLNFLCSRKPRVWQIPVPFPRGAWCLARVRHLLSLEWWPCARPRITIASQSHSPGLPMIEIYHFSILNSFLSFWFALCAFCMSSHLGSHTNRQSLNARLPPKSVSIPLPRNKDIWHLPSLPRGITKQSFNIFQRSRKIKGN